MSFVASPPPIPSLTGLRFFAALAIVLNHLVPVIFSLNSGIPFQWNFERLSLVGMSLFFTLSGFIIHYNYSSTVAALKPAGLWNFFVARFTRLYPLYLALLFIDLICTNIYLSNMEFREGYRTVLLYHILGVQSWWFGTVGTLPVAFAYRYTVVTWSISTEFFLYLVYPVIALGLARIRTCRAAIMTVLPTFCLSVLVVYLLRSHYGIINDFAQNYFGINPEPKTVPKVLFADWLAYISPYGRLPEFLTGCVVAHLVLMLRSPGRFEAIGSTIALLVALGYLGVSLSADMMATISISPAIYWAGMFPAMPIIIYYCARFHGIFTNLMSWKPLVLLGDASYSIYMLHVIIIQAFAPPPGTIGTAQNVTILILRAVIVLLVILIVSMGSFKSFETVARQYLRGHLSPKHRNTRPT